MLEIVIQEVLWSIRRSYWAICSLPLTNVKWPLTSYSYCSNDRTFHQRPDHVTELDLQRITSGFYEAFATGMAWQQGTLNLPDTCFLPSFVDSLVLQLLRPVFPKLPCLFPTFHLEYYWVLSWFILRMINFVGWNKNVKADLLKTHHVSLKRNLSN